MSASCDCSWTDIDGWSVGREEMRRARTSHRCCECGDVIKPGDQYEYASGCWDGEWSVYRTCLPCVAIRREYCPSGYIYGMLEETLRECLGFSPYMVPDCEEDE